MYRKCFKFYFFLPVLLFLVVKLSSGIGVAPAYHTVNFTQDAVVTHHQLKVYNTEKTDLQVTIEKQGTWAALVNLSEHAFTLSSDEDLKIIPYTVKHDHVPPGKHQITFLVRVQTASKEQGVTAYPAVTSRLYLIVPLYGSFLEIGLTSEENVARISYKNNGAVALDSIETVITILDKGKRIYEHSLDNFSLLPRKNVEKVFTWDTSLKGEFEILIIVNFDNQSIQKKIPLIVGEKVLFIRDISVSDFKPGTIARFDVLLESGWNKNIDDVRVSLRITNKGRLFQPFEIEPFKLRPGIQKQVSLYWDTKDAIAGTYQAEIRVDYDGKSIQKQYQFSISESSAHLEKPAKAKDHFLLAVIFLLISLYLVWRWRR